MRKTKLTIQNLTVGYDSPIVKNVDITFKSNHLSVLIGSNGCGKSTLLKCMARILKPMQGSVCLNGKSIHSMDSKTVAKTLALLPQGPIAPEGLTVKELVSQGRYPHQTLFRQWSSADEQAVQEAMDMANITELADKAISDLSGGQRQRCWIAMVLAQQTEIILLDEPTTYLDLKVQVNLMNLLSDLANKHQRTIVVVLHELNLAATYADELVMMHQGHIIAQGTPESVFTKQNIQVVFGLSANVVQDAQTNALLCIPVAVPSHKVSHKENCSEH